MARFLGALRRVDALGCTNCLRTQTSSQVCEALADVQRSGVEATGGLIERATVAQHPPRLRHGPPPARHLARGTTARRLEPRRLPGAPSRGRPRARDRCDGGRHRQALRPRCRHCRADRAAHPARARWISANGRCRRTKPPWPGPRGHTADECATVLATCLRPRCTGRGLERPKTAERRGLVDGAIVALLFHGALRRSEVAALCWTDVDLSDGADDVVVVTVPRSKTDPSGGVHAGRAASGRRLRGRGRSLHAAVSPETGDSVVGLGVDQINRRFAAACAAAGLKDRRMSHGGRVGLAVELTAHGASTHAIQLGSGPPRQPQQTEDRAQSPRPTSG